MPLVRSSVRALFFAALLTAILAPMAQAQEADLFVAKTGPAQSAADTDVPYDITVTNAGPDDASTVSLSDAIPAGMTFVGVTQNNGPAFSCSGGPTITCTLASLTSGASANFTFVFHINPGTPDGTDFNNFATVSTSTFDPNDENNTSVAITSTPPPPSSDIGASKSGPSAAGPNTDVVYTITFFNAGPDDDASATLNDTLPGTMTFVSLSQSGTPVSCNALTPGSGGTLTCTGAPFPANATTTLTLTGHIPPGTPSGTTFANSAHVTGSNDLSNENDDAATLLTVSSVDVSITKSGPPTVLAGSNVSYTLTIANAGPDTATGITLVDDLPAGTTFVSLTNNSGPIGSCSTPPVGSNGMVSCTFATLGNGQSSQYTLVIGSGSTTSISNTATVSTESFDTNTSNNSSTANTTVTQDADLSVTKTGPGTMTAGTNATYTITINNAGASNAVSVTLTDVLPVNTTFVSITQTSGPTFSCSGGPTITCTIASLANAATASFDVVVHVASSAPNGSTISNTATVTSATPDSNAGNNSSTTGAATVSASADVSVTKTGPAAVAPGADITYTVTVANAGPSDAATVQVTDTVPAGTTFVSENQTSGPTFSCSTPAVGGTGTITCSIASLVASASATFDFVMHVDPATTGTINNTANVTSATTDPTPGNSSSTSPAVVSPATTDLSITKTANNAQFHAGNNVTYTIVATNNGPAVATNVVVTDILPAGTTFVSATPTQGSCAGTTTVTCSVGTLLSGGSVTITLVVMLPQTIGPISNTASVTATNADSNPANNAATVAIAIVGEIPALSPLALALLALAMAGIGLFVARNR